MSNLPPPTNASEQLSDQVARTSLFALAEMAERLQVRRSILANKVSRARVHEALVQAIGEDYPRLLEQLRLVAKPFYLGDAVAALLIQATCRGYAVQALQSSGLIH